MRNGEKPILPCIIKGKQGFGSQPTIPDKEVYGLTKREYFAGLAMQGLMSNSKVIINDIDNMSACVRIADELLKKLEQ
jgi:hypothetical protein